MEGSHWLTQTQDESMTVGVGPTDKTVLQGVTVTKPLTLHAVVRKVSSLPSIQMFIPLSLSLRIWINGLLCHYINKHCNDCGLQGCNTMQFCQWIPVFWGNMMPPSPRLKCVGSYIGGNYRVDAHDPQGEGVKKGTQSYPMEKTLTEIDSFRSLVWKPKNLYKHTVVVFTFISIHV